jgi:hypothetical protein
MKKILTSVLLAMTTLPVLANDVQTVAPAMTMPTAQMMQVPQMQMPNMQMPNMNGYGGNNGSNWKMPNMQMPNMNGYGGNNGSNWKMPNMNWGNNGNNGSNWKMPNMNWGNNNSGWNGAPMYMAVPMAPNASMMRPVAPQMNPAQQAPMARAQQKENTTKPVQKLSAADIVRHKIEQMQRLNAAVAKQLSGAEKEAPKVDATVAK